MRPHLLLITLALAILFLLPPGANAQQTPQYVVLYSHGFGGLGILTALPQFKSQKAADLGNAIDFHLSPVLGRELQIDGAITYNLYLRATGPFAGTVSAQLAELQPDGTQVIVPGSTVETPVFLNTATIPFILGVGPMIDFQFQPGSSIVLHVSMVQSSGTGRSQLVWDDASAPTSVRIPTIASASLDITYRGGQSFGRIFQADATGVRQIEVNATLTDAIGVYRFSTALLQLARDNQSTVNLSLNPKNTTDYSTAYAFSANFTQGRWQVGLTLQDTSGNAYSFAEPLWVTAFYPVLIVVRDSDGLTLPNATLAVGTGLESFWSSVTNQTGWGTLMLPSTDIVGPLNLTVTWSGTQSYFPLEVTGTSTVTVQLTVYSANIRVTILNIPVPLARVTLYQAGQVGTSSTGVDGIARFGRLPAGDYTLTVEYLFTTYQTTLHVGQSGIMNIQVPFPHRTVTTILSIALVALASVVLVERRRGKFYPTDFNYFNGLTRGGLPEACFAVIAGNSGSGKTVLLSTLASEHLGRGSSVYITNTEYPDKIRENMMRLGVGEPAFIKDPKRLVFIDAYSAVGGAPSAEEFAVNSHTDLTQLGLSISKCLQSAGTGSDIYIDSLNPIITVLRIDYLINFLQTIAARVKANNGSLCVTVGTGIEEKDLTKLEESADCVIETQLHESGGTQRRRLRIKKVRGKPYDDHWTRFRVEEGKGIVFLTRKKAKTETAATELSH